MGSELPQIRITILPSCSADPAATATRSAAIMAKGSLMPRATTLGPKLNSPILRFYLSKVLPPSPTPFAQLPPSPEASADKRNDKIGWIPAHHAAFVMSGMTAI